METRDLRNKPVTAWLQRLQLQRRVARENNRIEEKEIHESGLLAINERKRKEIYKEGPVRQGGRHYDPLQ